MNRLKVNGEESVMRTYTIPEEMYNEFKKKCMEKETDPAKFIRKSIKEFIGWKKPLTEEEFNKYLMKYIDDDEELITLIQNKKK